MILTSNKHMQTIDDNLEIEQDATKGTDKPVKINKKLMYDIQM